MICPECNGKGEVKYYREVDRDETSVTVEGHLDICHTCHGSGEKLQTNADHIRSMSDEELAERNVQDSLEYTFDYDWDERPIGEYTPCFKTSDGAVFWSYEDAVEYELHWLRQPYKEEV